MIIAQAMPGELGVAHSGRISYLNGISTLADLRRILLGKSRDHRKRDEFRQPFKVISTRLGIDSETYLANHSLLPFTYACPPGNKERYSYQDLVAAWLKPADGQILKHLRFCLECAQQDAIDVGFCWWRREHQLPGVDICIHHHKVLCLVHDDRAAERLPSHYVKDTRYVLETSPNWQDEAVARYRAFAVSLLAQRVEPSRLRLRVRQRCIELAIGSAKKHHSCSSISRHVRSRFPNDWLQKHRPMLLHPSYEGRDLMIDAGFRGQGAPGMAIVMALASLFDRFEDLNCEQATFRTSIWSARPPIAADASKSVQGFARIFVAEQGDCRRIARAIGCARRTAACLRLRFGLPAVPRLLTASHHIAFDRIHAASETDLKNWGTEMHRYWKARPSRGPRGADLAEFLRISGG